MVIVRFSPSQEMGFIRQAISQSSNPIESCTASENLSSKDTETSSFDLVAEIQETPETITLRMELFEVEPQKLYIKVSCKSVSIRGERKLKTKQDVSGGNCVKLCHDSFQHMIPLPARILNHQAYAEFRDGVLHLSLPKIREGKITLLGEMG